MSRVSLVLTIGALLSALLILVLGIQLTVPFLGFQIQIPPSFLERFDDKGFPQGLIGNVPQYQAYRTNDDRDCSAPYPYAQYCYHVETKADDARSMALIVEDIIREDNIEETQDRMVAVYFYHPGTYYGESGYASAYAFRSEDLAKQYLATYDYDHDATAIDRVYIIKPEADDLE